MPRFLSGLRGAYNIPASPNDWRQQLGENHLVYLPDQPASLLLAVANPEG